MFPRKGNAFYDSRVLELPSNAIAMEGERENEIKRDRISNLPEFILHQILSFLPTKQAARTSALSKKWLQSYSTSPVLTFNESYFHNSPEIEENRYPFLDFVKNTLLRYRNLNLRIQKFEINVFHANHTPAYRLLDESLGIAFSNGVEELYISILSKVEVLTYTLPVTIFESPKMLTNLSVHKCKFPQNVVSTSKCNAIVFPFLKKLNLNLAYMDDGMLQKLLSFSPSLEEISFHDVSGFNTFRVSNLSELKVITIASRETIEIDIEDAPSLRLFKCVGYLRSPCLLNVGSAPNLRCLKLFFVSISENSLEELVMKSHLLEDLDIFNCYGLERINIVSGSLKRLRFMGCVNLLEVKIDAPSLLLLHYNGQMIFLSLNNTPEGLKPYIKITSYFSNWPSTAWFHQLRELMKGVKRGRVLFRIVHQNQGIEFGTVHDFRANPLPPVHQIDNFMPEINKSSSLFAAFVETLFSSSRPTIIYNMSCESRFDDFIKFLICELTEAIGNSNCCSSDQTKCWRHYLKDIKVWVLEDSEKGWQPLHQESSLSEVTFCGKNFLSSLKWHANLNDQV